MMGVFGLCGQVGMSGLATLGEKSHDQRPLLDRLSSSKWSPFQSIPDADYKRQLQDQIDGIDVEISIVNERISSLKNQRQAFSVKE